MDETLEQLLKLTESRLLEVLGEDLIAKSARNAFPIAGMPREVAVVWLDLHRHEICQRIAASQKVRRVLTRPAEFERIELIASVVDALILFTKMVPVAVLAAIILHRGRRAFCAAELLMDPE